MVVENILLSSYRTWLRHYDAKDDDRIVVAAEEVEAVAHALWWLAMVMVISS